MIRNETFQNGVCIEATVIDLEAGTWSHELAGVIVETRPLTLDEVKLYGPQPLAPLGALATLLAVKEIVPVEDAANAVGLTADALTSEALAWAAAKG